MWAEKLFQEINVLFFFFWTLCGRKLQIGNWAIETTSVVTSLFGARDWFHGRQFSTDGVGSGDGFRMIQAHCIHCALPFCYYDISATSDHQALDPRGWGTLDQTIVLTSEFSLQKKYVVGRRSLSSGPDVTLCESQCQSLFSHWVSICLVCNTARMLLTLYLQGPLWILFFPWLLDILNGRSCVSSWKDPWASIPPLQSSHPLRGLAWKTVMGGQGPLERVMWANLLPSFGAWTAQHPSVTLGCCFASQKCVFLGEEKDYFLVWRMGAECQMREVGGWGHQFHSCYLRADLVQCCVPRARLSPTPQYLQCGH